MAIQDNDKSQASQQAEQTTAQPQQGYSQSQGYQQPSGQPQVNGLVNLNNILRRSGSFDGTESRSAEALQALRDASEKAVAAQALTNEHELLRFDRDANRVGLPSILVVKTVKREGQIYAIVRTLMLDTDAVRLKPRVLQLGNERIEVPTLPQHVFNEAYWNRIAGFLRDQRGIANLVVADAGPLVVPTDFDFKDSLKATALLVSSVNRCDDIIAKLVGETPFSVAAIKGQDEFFTSRMDLTGAPKYDLMGNPKRSDIVISMGRSSKNTQGADDFYDADTSFNSLSCFVNLEYTPPQAQPQGPWNPQPVPTQLFTPTIVVTDVSQAEWITANTAELYLLALSNAYRVTANTQWARAFLPVMGKKKDPRDIGALGFLVQNQNGQPGTKIKTKGESFTDADFVTLMQTLIKPLPSFLIDIDPMGENAAIEGLFLEAAGNGPNKAKASEAILRAANNLTNNAMSEFFDHTKFPIVVPYNVDVNLGYYFDEHSERRDIRDLGTLEMLNATDGDLGAFTAWYRTMCDTSIPTDLRMKQRAGFEELYLGSNLVRTGVATRIMFHPQFIQALDAACSKVGVNVNFENLSTVFGVQRFTGNDLVGQYTVQGAAQINYAGGQQQAGYGINSNYNPGRIY